MNRAQQGALAYHAGLAAEEQVAERYRRVGADVSARRWRGRFGGEIDLIARDGDVLVFVEVKRARTHAVAAERLSMHQLRRIGIAAEEYAALYAAGRGQKMRFDLALVDGAGRIEVIENASMF